MQALITDISHVCCGHATRRDAEADPVETLLLLLMHAEDVSTLPVGVVILGDPGSDLADLRFDLPRRVSSTEEEVRLVLRGQETLLYNAAALAR
jgi:hypothetical protein